MPGILPMKVIRVGSSTQSRIAQACDRCRSKKIRCDGIRPCCTQCSNVGFECKTSDKLSRRAFPRGYTESLEDRVRGLEAEVRELKDLLDEKDEKIDMLSRIHNFSPSSRKCSTSLSPSSSAQVKAELESAREDVLHVENAIPAEPASPSLGTSSTAAFITAFDNKVQESGKEVPSIRLAALIPQPHPSASSASQRNITRIPPRLLSDQYINLFFQEWQPLLPIFHRASFLRLYEQYLTDPEASHWHSNKQAISQLYLIFDISALSSSSRPKQATSYECQWRKALQSTSSNASVSTVQCHVLAQLYYLLKADYARLARHRAIAVSMCHQLGLHQCQNYLSLTVFESETRKKVFWSQYVLDKFTSAATGTPMLFQETDITTEYPADVDDENLSLHGFSLALPGELTKISSALALFKAARILSKTLAQLYPAQASYQLSLSKLRAISDELDQWSTNLPTHLRLQFVKDKPSTNMISCRSPLLFLAYFYIRSLIHRPIVCHGFGSSASASTIAVAAAAKHVVQILDLLDERRMNYTFPLNKSELLLSSGFAVLWQCLDLESDSKLVKDNQKTLTVLVDILSREAPAASVEFVRIASEFVTLGNLAMRRQQEVASAQVSRERLDAAGDVSMPAPPEKQRSTTRKQLQAIASRLSTFAAKPKPDDSAAIRRSTVPRETLGNSAAHHGRTYSTISLASTRSLPTAAESMCSPAARRHRQLRTAVDLPTPNVNLDYFPIGEEEQCGTTHSSSTATLQNRQLQQQQQPHHFGDDASWEQLLTNIDNGAIYSGGNLYQGHPLSSHNSASPENFYNMHQQQHHVASSSHSQEWTTPGTTTGDDWPNLSAIDLGASTSGDSLGSGISQDDLVFSAPASHNGSLSTSESVSVGERFKGIAIAMPEACDGGAEGDYDFQELDLDDVGKF